MNYEILIFSINTKNFYNQVPKELQTKFIKFPNQKKVSLAFTRIFI